MQHIFRNDINTCNRCYDIHIYEHAFGFLILYISAVIFIFTVQKQLLNSVSTWLNSLFSYIWGRFELGVSPHTQTNGLK